MRGKERVGFGSHGTEGMGDVSGLGVRHDTGPNP